MQLYDFTAMTTQIRLGALGNDKFVEKGFEAVAAWIHSCEERFTRFTDTSELATLNRSSGRWVNVSPDLYDLLTDAYDLVEMTGGLFDPSILPELIQSGYDRSIEVVRERENGAGGPSAEVLGRTRGISTSGRISFNAARLEPRDQSARLQPGMKLDLGGVAKGWMAERAAHRLAAYADSVVVDIGGDMFILGEPEGEPTWRIGLEDPLNLEADLAVLHVKSPVAVATSSIVKRSWMQSTVKRHHIIDPRTGEPADTDWLSVTAVAQHGAQAEAYAKSLLIAGSREAEALSQSLPGLAYIGVDQSSVLWGSENSQELLYVTEKY